MENLRVDVLLHHRTELLCNENSIGGAVQSNGQENWYMYSQHLIPRWKNLRVDVLLQHYTKLLCYGKKKTVCCAVKSNEQESWYSQHLMP